MNKEKAWHMYFNPCGGEPMRGYVLNRCHEPCQRGRLCLARGAHEMSGYLLSGNTVATERRDYGDFLRTLVGQRVVDLDGNLVVLTQENFNQILEATTRRAQEIVTGVGICEEMTLPVTEEYIAKLTPEQQGVLEDFSRLNDEAERFGGTVVQAKQHVEKTRDILRKAIELDLDELGLIARQAIAYGLGEQVLAKRGIPQGTIPTNIGRLQQS